jgi:LytS/YehU family sensor histidine kinase
MLVDGHPYAFAASDLVAYVDYGVLLYWMIWLISVGVAYAGRLKERELREAELETRLARAQLHALQSQLQPHFLFNTLNAISALVTRDPAGARRTITLLSGLMRETLALGALQEVPLDREIVLMRQYLEIEQERFGDRLSVRVNVDPAVERALVPSLILQPLLENAFKHGLSQKRGMVGIDITAARVDGMVTLSVENDGGGIHAAAPGRAGVGIQNTRARLERLYGDQARFELSEGERGRVRADIMLPFHEEPMHG